MNEAADTLTMAETAGAVGLSYDWFRHTWPTLCTRDGFPAPIRGRVWLKAAVEAWRVGQSLRPVRPGRTPRGRLANAQPQLAITDQRRAERDRRALDDLRAS